MRTGMLAVSVAQVSKEIELRRHTDADGASSPPRA
jgi:hypothetical protein